MTDSNITIDLATAEYLTTAIKLQAVNQGARGKVKVFKDIDKSHET